MRANPHQSDVSPDPPDRVAEWILLLVQLPGDAPKRAGVLLLDPASDKLYSALLDHVSEDENVSEIWASLHQDLEQRASEIGAAAFLDTLENELSHFLQIEGPRKQISTLNPAQTLEELFLRHVLHDTRIAQNT
jgi:hypothetical protein